MMKFLNLAFALSAALPLAASARSYDETKLTNFNNTDVACSSALLFSVVGTCDTVQQGRDACDNNGKCNAFMRNSIEKSCYLYSMTAGLITKCSTGCWGCAHDQT